MGPGERVTAVRDNLVAALLAGLGEEDSKTCRGPCGKTLPLRMFRRNKKGDLQRHRSKCRLCEKAAKAAARRR